jgi:predicted RND superfamily exporter protein
MKNIVFSIVDKRVISLILMITVAVIGLFFMNRVVIGDDVLKYLNKDSKSIEAILKQEEVFGKENLLYVVVKGYSETEELSVFEQLKQIDDVSSVYYDDGEEYHHLDYTLFIVSTTSDVRSDSAKNIIDTIESTYPDVILGGMVYTSNQPIIPMYLIVIAIVILVVLLIVFTKSWVEPLIILFTLGIAVILNLFTNIFLESISMFTFSISALLQLCLSIDYAIILINRYHKERETYDKEQAIQFAVLNSIRPIVGSSFTTIVGLLCLLFMSSQIGLDLGFVLAKGVLFSLISVLFVLPGILTVFDRLIRKTLKRTIQISFTGYTKFIYKFRYVFIILFLAVFTTLFIIQDTSNVAYLAKATNDETVELFPRENQVVVLYDDKDEEHIEDVINTLSTNEEITKINALYTTIYKPLSSEELAYLTQMDQAVIDLIFTQLTVEEMNIYELITIILTQFQSSLNQMEILTLQGIKNELDEGIMKLQQDGYSRMIITTNYELDSLESRMFVQNLDTDLNNKLNYSYYLLGDDVVSNEVEESFIDDYQMIIIATLVTIFVIVLVTFRSLRIPFILVLVIQTAVFITTYSLSMFLEDTFFMALFILQAILMGATIDYGILFTSSYLASKEDVRVKKLEQAFDDSYHTILTSSSILFFVTLTLGLISKNPTIYFVVRALAIGTFSATFLIFTILPAAVLFVEKRKS